MALAFALVALVCRGHVVAVPTRDALLAHVYAPFVVLRLPVRLAVI